MNSVRDNPQNPSFRAVVDRFEGEYAVVFLGEEEYQIDIPRRFLPPGTMEGDVLRLEWGIDLEETRRRKKRIKGLIDDLLKGQ